MKLRHLFVATILSLLAAASAEAQVTIAPTTLFLDNHNKFGTFLVLNGSNQTQEVSIDFMFGYPASDSLGHTVMMYGDTLDAAKFSIAKDMRGFPRTFTLAPQQRQVIRLTVRPRADRKDGMYWTRIKTTSNPATPPIGETSQNGVTAQINFKFEQITAAFYKKGKVSTGLNFKGLHTEIDSTGGHIYADVERTGNAPYLGSIFLTIKDADGNTVGQGQSSTTVYFDDTRTMDFDASGLAPGNYTAEVTFRTQRPDIPQDKLVQADPVSKTTTFTIR